MMHGREKSDSAIVAGKPTNKAVPTAAEPVERRAGAEGNANRQSTDRAQNRTTRRNRRSRNIASGLRCSRGSYRQHAAKGIDVNNGDPFGSNERFEGPTSRQGEGGLTSEWKSD